MLLALCATLIVIVVLLSEVAIPALHGWNQRRKARRARPHAGELEGYDPGRERRAEQRARALLRSCVNDEEWEMYRDLGFLRVWGGLSDGPGDLRAAGGAPYAYLIYPHKPVVAFLPQTRELLAEYCVRFPDETRPYGSPMLPDSDDVLAKWMALTGDERRLLRSANLHLPGRQVDPEQVRRDLWRLTQWEQERMRRQARELRTSSPASGDQG